MQNLNKMKTLKLEVGKTYRSREGKEVRIIEKGGEVEYSYEGSDGEWYTENGKWSYGYEEHPNDLIEEVEEVPETRHTFAIPDGVKEITLDYFGNRIVVEMVPEKEPKPGDVMINDWGGVYILKEVKSDDTHMYFVMLGKNGHLFSWSSCFSGRPATTEEAQPLFDALKKAGKRWNAETMQVEEIPESTRILEWVEEHLNDGIYSQQGIAEVIGHYLKQKEGVK